MIRPLGGPPRARCQCAAGRSSRLTGENGFRGETDTDNQIPGAVSVPAVENVFECRPRSGTVREPIQPLSDEESRRTERLYERLDDDVERFID